MSGFKNLSFNFFKKLLVYFAIFYLPFQTSKYFFLPQSYILGVRKDFLAPALYFKYILIVTVIVLCWKILEQVFVKHKKRLVFLTAFFLLNLVFSQNKPITLYKIFQLFLVLSLATLLWKLKKRGVVKGKGVLTALLAGAILEFFLVFYQVVKGSSLQGLFYFLGERAIDVSSPGVAKTVFFEKLLLRGYGTFSHPNSLAGFYLFLYFLSFKKFFKKSNFALVVLFRAICSFIIFLSFSKAAIFAFIIGNVLVVFKKRECFICKLSQSAAFILSGTVFLSASFRKESLLERAEQLFQAKQIFLKHPLFGTGLGAYLTALSKIYSYLPPFSIKNLHNALLLVLIESGIIVLPTLFFVLKNVSVRKFLKENWLVVFVVVFTSLFDHYWWSLPQNLFVLSLIVF